MTSQKYKITLAYDGTDFGGWAKQPNAPSIQEHLEEALRTLTGKQTVVTGSGRTDAGVHARAQIAHFESSKAVTLRSLNALLPQTIRITSLEKAPKDFHARFSAKRKTYHYSLNLTQVTDPFTSKYTTHFPYPLDLSLMKEALPYFIGTHDFTSFANVGGSAKEMTKRLYRLDLIPTSQGIRLEFEGNGFLYKMVRNIVGTLLDIAQGKIPISELESIFSARDRKKSGRAAPPEGLTLHAVEYSEEAHAAPLTELAAQTSSVSALSQG